MQLRRSVMFLLCLSGSSYPVKPCTVVFSLLVSCLHVAEEHSSCCIGLLRAMCLSFRRNEKSVKTSCSGTAPVAVLWIHMSVFVFDETLFLLFAMHLVTVVISFRPACLSLYIVVFCNTLL